MQVIDCSCYLQQPRICCLCVLTVNPIVHSRTKTLPAHPIPAWVSGCDPHQKSIDWSQTTSPVAEDRQIHIAHEKTSGAEHHLVLAAALWQQKCKRRCRDMRSRILWYLGVLNMWMGNNFERGSVPWPCVENVHSVLEESIVCLLIYAAKKIEDIAVNHQGSESILCHCNQVL